MFRILITRQSRYPVDSKSLKKRVTEVLQQNGVSNAEVSIAMVGERKMKELSKTHLGEENGKHEVLSFPFIRDDVKASPGHPEGILQLGEIIICYPEARKIAIRRNRLMDDLIGELAEHGTLHLLGKHHE